MSQTQTEQEFRFPTLGKTEIVWAGNAFPGPPIHPQPGIYESIRVSLKSTEGSGYYDHHDIEQMASAPTWDQRLPEIQEQVLLRGKGDRTKVGPTPARKERHTGFQRGSESGCYS